MTFSPPSAIVEGSGNQKNWEKLSTDPALGLGTPASGAILLSNSSLVPTWVVPTGDVTITAAGVTAIEAGVIVNADVNAAAAIAASKLDPLLVQSTVENLKVIRGTVDTTGAGSIVKGSGFTISTRTGTGDITLAFTAAFSDVPSPTTTAQSSTNGSITTIVHTLSASSMRVQRLQPGVSTLDGVFHFIAIGPR